MNCKEKVITVKGCIVLVKLLKRIFVVSIDMHLRVSILHEFYEVMPLLSKKVIFIESFKFLKPALLSFNC